MRAFLVIFFSALIFSANSQNFVSPGIIAYHSGAYERTIQDMNKAFQTTRGMDSETRSKAYYYRGMARLSLLKAGTSSEELGNDPYLAAYNDLDRAVLLDPQWRESAQAEMALIYRQLLASAKRLYDRGIYSNDENEVRSIFGSAILQITTAAKIDDTFEANDLMGKSYDALGVFYDQLVDQSDAGPKAISSYQSAQRFHEKALQINPNSLETIKALRQLAYRFGDRDKEIYYAQLEANIDG
ncbi:MAG: hypothetical protein ABJG78_00955 [Cyclobacteriaceae bacterium]